MTEAGAELCCLPWVGLAANVGEVISVAATNLPTKFNTTAYMDTETLYSWNNYGSCIDILAPGVDIYAACGGQGKQPLWSSLVLLDTRLELT